MVGGGEELRGRDLSIDRFYNIYMLCILCSTYHTSQAKVWNALFLERGDEDDVEVAAGIIPQAE